MMVPFVKAAHANRIGQKLRSIILRAGLLFFVTYNAIAAELMANRPFSGDGLSSERYREEIFDAVTITRDIPYGQAVNVVTGENEILLLDLYEPEGDLAIQRPAIVWMHGGAFVGGDKSSPHITDLCNPFAKRGYINVSINYRLHVAQVPEAVTQAYEDAKAAVRWLRANASTYRIDSTRIAVGGSSSGAFAALHAAYEENEGNSGSTGFSSEVGACIDFWGALVDDAVMDFGEAPLLIIHGTEDDTVPYEQALELQSRAQTVGVPYELHTLEGQGHAAWELIDEYIKWISDFLYQYLISNFPVPVQLSFFSARVENSRVCLSWRTVSEGRSVGFVVERSVGNAEWKNLGFVPGHSNTSTPRDYHFEDAQLLPGSYQYRLKQLDTDGVFTYSEAIQVVVSAPEAFQLMQNSPNPFGTSAMHGATRIRYSVPLHNSGDIELSIFNVLGQEVRRFSWGRQPPGEYELKWDGRDQQGELVSQGIYLYCLKAGLQSLTRKMLVR
jgi:acetyl esterase/lipase